MKYLCLLLISLPAFGQFGAASRILSGTGAPVAAQCTVENNVGLVWARKDGADVGTTFYVCGATGVGTYGWELRGGAPGGGAALSTVGSVPFVTAAGVLGQSGNVFWDSASSRFRIGGTVAGFGEFRNASNAVVAFYGTASGFMATGTTTDLGLRSTSAILFATNGDNERARFAATSGNLLLGTTTDGGFKLDVADSGSSGGLRVWDQRATIGSTSLVVRAGAGQSGNLTTWQNSAGATLAGIASTGFLSVPQVYLTGDWLNLRSTTADMASGYALLWASTGSQSGTKDLSLSRASAGVLQVGDGGANANGSMRFANWTNDVGINGIQMSNGFVAQPVTINGLIANARASTLAGLVVNGATGHTGDIAQFVPSPGATIPLRITASGEISFATTASSATVATIGGTSSGLLITNPTPTTGSTSLVVRAGAGQTGYLTDWRDSSNNTNAYVQSQGNIYAFNEFQLSTTARIMGLTGSFRTRSAGQFQFSSDTTGFGTPDAAFGRFAAGRIELNSGTAIGTTPANARDIMARGFYAAETTTDPSAADLTIAGSNAQDTFRLYMKNDKLVIAYQRSGTVNYLTIPLDGATTTFTQSTTAP